MKEREVLQAVLLLVLVMSSAIPFSEAASVASGSKSVVDKAPAVEEKTTEAPPAIAVEGAEESEQADRAKKSATTTFCVEIRPEPSATPVKVCDNHPSSSSSPPASIPQIPQEAHEINGPQPPTHSNGHENPEVPVFVIPPNPAQGFFPQIPPQYINVPSFMPHPQAPPPQQNIIIPAPVTNPYPQSPCPPCPCASGFNPHAFLTLFRSTMAPMNALTSLGGMTMRSSADEASDMNSAAASPSGMELAQDFGSEIVGSPISRGYLKRKPIGHPSSLHYPSVYHPSSLHYPSHHPAHSHYPSVYHRAAFPYTVQYNPQTSSSIDGGSAYATSSAWSRSSDGDFGAMSNQQSMTVADPMIMQMSQQTQHNMIQPYMTYV